MDSVVMYKKYLYKELISRFKNGSIFYIEEGSVGKVKSEKYGDIFYKVLTKINDDYIMFNFGFSTSINIPFSKKLLKEYRVKP